jgi:hypothetical protein
MQARLKCNSKENSVKLTMALERLRQKNQEFKASLGYMTRLCLKKKNQEKSS